MIYGIGVDLVDVSRFEKAIEQTPKLKERLFTQSEIGLNSYSLAARFAAKEALTKAVGNSKGLSFQEVSVVKNEHGKPYFELSGQSRQTVETAGIKNLHLSLSHDGDMAIAYVIAEASQ
jgi:holo-[acyl-carrier protein] synthase